MVVDGAVRCGYGCHGWWFMVIGGDGVVIVVVVLFFYVVLWLPKQSSGCGRWWWLWVWLWLWLMVEVVVVGTVDVFVGKYGFVSHTKNTVEATNMDLFHS